MALNDLVAATLAGNGNDAPAPNAVAPTPPPAAPDISAPSPASTASPTAPTVGTASTPTPANQPAQPEPQPPALIHPQHRSMFGALASALIGGTLGTVAKGVKAAAGPAPVDYSVDSSGKTVATPRPDTTASRLQRLAEAALMGLAYGAQAGPQKSAAASWAAGLGAGAQGQMQHAQGQDLLKRQQAQEQFEEQQKATLHKANIALTNAQTHATWMKLADDENAKDAERAKNMAIVNDLNDYIAQNPQGQTSKNPLTVQTVTEAQAKAALDSDSKTVASDPNHAHIAVTHVVLPIGVDVDDAQNEDGSPRLIRKFALITGAPDAKLPMPQAMVDAAQKYSKSDQRLRGAAQLQAGQEIPLSSFLSAYKFTTEDVGKEADGWKPDQKQFVTVNGKPMEENKFTGERRERTSVPLAVQKEEGDIAEKGAQTRKADAETAKLAEETRQLKEWDANGPDGKGRADAFGNPVGAPGMDKKEYLKRVDTYTKDYSKDLNQLDAARSQLSDIINNAEKTKKLPGADAVVGIFDAIGISSAPLKGRGFRINNSVVSEHVEGTRNAWQSMALKLSRLTPDGTGQIVSLEQLKDYERIMDQARHDAYVGAGNDAVNRGIGIQFAPRGNGRPVDANTIDIFLTLAKGDATKASALLKQYGWTPPEGN